MEDRTELAAPAAYPGTSISVGDLVEEWSTSAVVRIEVMELRDIRGAISLELLNGSGTVVGTLTEFGDIYEATNTNNVVKKIRGTATTTATINGNAGGHALLRVTILNVDIVVDLEDREVNGVRSGLKQDTLKFDLNGNVIPNSSLTLLPTTETIDGDQITTKLKVTYIPSCSELNLPGSNIVKVDIDDVVSNHMDQVVNTFSLP